jgi:hypothetical protein
MSAFPQTTGVVNLVNVDLANTLDFHIATTNHLKIIQKYSNDIATYYIYNHIKHTADPITSQVDFFLNLNYDRLDLKTDQRGTFNPKVMRDTITGYKLSKLDTLLNPTEVWIRSDDGLPERRTEVGAVSSYHAIDLLTQKDKWYIFTEDIDKTVKKNLNKLQNKYGSGKMPFELLQYWYEKLRTSHDKIREDYKALLLTEGITSDDDIFTDLSDTIGSLARLNESVDPELVPITIERNFDTFGEHISTLPPSITDKLTTSMQEYNGEMTEKVNTLFRININIPGIIQSLASPDTAHQSNLMSDILHKKRMSAANEELNGLIAESLGKSYALLFYLRNRRNIQQATSPTFETVIENSIVQVDMLKNRIERLNKAIGNQALNSRSVNSPDLS